MSTQKQQARLHQYGSHAGSANGKWPDIRLFEQSMGETDSASPRLRASGLQFLGPDVYAPGTQVRRHLHKYSKTVSPLNPILLIAFMSFTGRGSVDDKPVLPKFSPQEILQEQLEGT